MNPTTDFRKPLCLLVVVLLLPSCQDRGNQDQANSPASPTESANGNERAGIQFVDATERVGLDFQHDCGTQRTYFVPELIGPGAALLDFDNDGDLDVYLVNGRPAPKTRSEQLPCNRFFRRERDGTYTDITAATGLGDTGYGMGVAIGDYNNDGFVDVYVTNYGANVLFRNQRDGTFVDTTDEAGVGHTEWGVSALFFDYDGDQYLDLFVANYLDYDPDKVCRDMSGREEFCGPEQFPGTQDVLYHNNQDGTFTDVTESAGIVGIGRKGLGVVAADLTGDGLVDLYVTNDGDPNQLWVNGGDGTFRDEALGLGAAFNDAGQVEASMGVVCDDLDGDLDFDLFMTHLRGESNTLFRNDGSLGFQDSTAGTGMLASSLPFTGFGAAAGDLDHDGDLDLVTVNGHVFRGPVADGANVGDFWNPYAQTGVVLRNDGDTFTDVSRESGSFGTVPAVGRGLALGDIDDDGDLDLLTTSCNGRAALLLNTSDKRGAWLIVRVVDPSTKRDAIGARVELFAGDRRWVRLVRAGYSFLSSGDMRAHFGLGERSRVDGIDITWPDGTRERFSVDGVNQSITLQRGSGTQLGRETTS